MSLINKNIPWYKRKRFWFLILILLILVNYSSWFPQNQKVGENNSVNTNISKELKDSYKIGDVVDLSGLKVCVTAIEKNISVGSNAIVNEFLKPKAGNMLVRVNLYIENNLDRKENISTFLSMYLKNSEGVKGQQSLLSSEKSVDGELLKGEKVVGAIVYEIPINSKDLKFYYNPSIFTGKSIIFSEN